MMCLPLAEHLNSLTLISTTTGLIILVLLMELWGTSCIQDSFSYGNNQCRYTADCKMRKTDLEDAVRRGETINIEELAERETRQQGLYEPRTYRRSGRYRGISQAIVYTYLGILL